VSHAQAGPAGVEIRVLGAVDSTNDEVRRVADAGAIGPLWVRADSQSKGRGRRGRSWLSEPGNLFMTGLLTLGCTPAEAANLSFVTALSVAEALDHFVDSTLIQLKWPNDVLIQGRKTSGILLESWSSQLGFQIAIGIGINVVTVPDNIDEQITCVAQHLIPDGNYCDAATLFSFVLRGFHKRLAQWHEQGFEPIRDAWLLRAKGVGQPIVARLANETLDGIFVGLARNGALIMKLPDGTYRHITAGDVFFAH
jgi:BirA family transcriptional regulator, biotin operon repressor / biotin---[acetyl-CoA-carboxylase] ligase